MQPSNGMAPAWASREGLHVPDSSGRSMGAPRPRLWGRDRVGRPRVARGASLAPSSRTGRSYALYYLPILWAAWYGGVGPTLAAIAFSVSSAWYLFVPATDPRYYATTALFLAVSAAMLMMARALRAKQDAGAFAAAVIDSSDDAIVTKDLEGTIRSWNGGAERLFGYPPAEIVGRPITVLIPPEHQDEEREILQRIRRGERIEHFETVRLTKGGRRVEVSLTVSPVRDRFGAIIGASKAARDISDRKCAEGARGRARVARLHAEEHRRCRDLHGRRRAGRIHEPRRRAPHRLVERRRPRTELRRGVSHRQRGHARHRREPRLARAPAGDGGRLGQRHRPLPPTARSGPSTTAFNIRHEGGRAGGAVLVFRDISDRRRLEAQRREAFADREHLLERERAARSQAEQASRSKDEFVAMVSHELRTPLSAIAGWARILKEKPQEVEAVRRGIEVIERNSRDAGGLIDDLLDMSRIISGKLLLDVRDVNLIALINAAIEVTRPAAEGKGISVSSTLDPNVAATTGDPTRLQQCIWNLLSNALKFTPQGGRVNVSLGRSDSHVEIKVSDNGIGRSPTSPRRLRAVPARRDAVAQPALRGLGLGLAIVKQLTELHGGHVSVESLRPGSRPTPILGASGDRRRDVAAREPDGEGSLESVTVLVVEDDPDHREVHRTLPEQHHATVTPAASPREALDLVPTVRPSILVSDIGLPETDGYELIRRIREGGMGPVAHIPAIALTAHASADDRGPCVPAIRPTCPSRWSPSSWWRPSRASPTSCRATSRPREGGGPARPRRVYFPKISRSHPSCSVLRPVAALPASSIMIFEASARGAAPEAVVHHAPVGRPTAME